MRTTLNVDGYEKIKPVGQGSFGTATLYKRLSDNIMVVMKEVHLTDMSSTERKLALNEVEVLSSLNHENIIRYLGSFEKDGSLIIIMEYANDGNLAQLINLKKDNGEIFSEKEILNIFSQISSGISYMHSNKILHRDMKSANIFLNKNGTVKIGDFGISKMMDTRAQANTVVGTPYYLSPEMCEGREYNEKSDIWAMGCILYELTTLRKPFEANSLKGLVQKIIASDFPPIPKTYSQGLSDLVGIILQKDPESRPPASYIYDTVIPILEEDLPVNERSRRLSLGSLFNRTLSKERSVLYELFGFTSEPNLFPVPLPHRKILDFSNSETHYMVATSDKKVYTWGEDSFGQLAHGKPETYKKYPIPIDYLRGKNIVRCFAGEGYSVFMNNNGILLTCGDGRYGCLGHGDWNNVLRPKIIESLLNYSITEVSAGSKHVLALAKNGKVFVWGSAQDGQLGLGHSQFCCKPMSVNLPNDYNIEKVFAGFNNSALLTTSGKVMFSGNNNFRKLGFENISHLKTFLMVTNIPEKIKNISLGLTHTVLLSESGNVFCMGNNQHFQCGKGKNVNGIYKIDGLTGVQFISAGMSYTVAGTEDNVIFFWGTHFKDANNQNTEIGSSGNSQDHLVSSEIGSLNEIRVVESTIKSKYAETSFWIEFVEPKPKPILVLYASPENVKSNNILWLAGLTANENSISILVHTTAPPPIRKLFNDDEHDNQSRIVDSNHTSWNHVGNNTSLPNTPEVT